MRDVPTGIPTGLQTNDIRFPITSDEIKWKMKVQKRRKKEGISSCS